jgi:hypothetical protein
LAFLAVNLWHRPDGLCNRPLEPSEWSLAFPSSPQCPLIISDREAQRGAFLPCAH